MNELNIHINSNSETNIIDSEQYKSENNIINSENTLHVNFYIGVLKTI